MIIDFHTHIFSPVIINNREKYAERDPLFRELYASPKAKLISAEDLIASMDDQEIDVSVILNINWHSSELCRESNEYILDSVNRFPKRLIGFGMVKLDDPETAIPEIEYCVNNGAKGIGEIRPKPDLLQNTGAIQPVMQKIIENKMIVLTHSSEPIGHSYAGKGDLVPEVLYSLIIGFPELKLVCAHWGGGLPFYALMPEVKKALTNVFFDSAASPFLYRPEIYTQVAELVGPEKVIFGTDYPLLKPKRLLGEIEALNIPQKMKNQILMENACRLLGVINRE